MEKSLKVSSELFNQEIMRLLTVTFWVLTVDCSQSDFPNCGGGKLVISSTSISTWGKPHSDNQVERCLKNHRQRKNEYQANIF